MVLLDLDIVSCFTWVLLGFYPSHLPLIKQAVTTDGIWKAFEKQFQISGKGLFFFTIKDMSKFVSTL